jgi:hypothetical protein
LLWRKNLKRIVLFKENKMEERRYEVLEGDQRLATEMTLEDALLFIKAIFEKYYMERSMVLSVREAERVKEDIKE